MSSFWSQSLTILMPLFFFMSHNICTIEASLPHQYSSMRISTISAAPALLPDPSPAQGPALSPDITPLFPTPGADTFPPSESSLPTIPSSPSPPNPDALSAPSPYDLAFPPSGLLAASSSSSSAPFNLVFIFIFISSLVLLNLSSM